MKIAQLRTRIVSYFVGICALISVIYGITAFIFTYHIEDQFFKMMLEQEAHLISEQIEQGENANPSLPFVTYHKTKIDLPSFIAEAIEQQPTRQEFARKDDQHFHLITFKYGFLLAEVSNHLVVRNNKGDMLHFLMVVFAIVSVIATLVGFLAYSMTRKLFTPLNRLITIVEQAPVEHLPQGFSQQFQKDEVGGFASALEQALHRIRDFVKREQNFTRDVSHELRTPVTVTQGAVKLLKQTPLSDTQMPLVSRIEQAQIHIEQTLVCLLSIAREQTDSSVSTRLLPLIEQSVLQHHHLLEGKDIELVIEVSPHDVVPIASSPMTILLNNLISNAFNYTESGTIGLCYSENSLSISDTGSGVSPKLLDGLFDDGVKHPNSQGLGMGLNIVKRLCESLDIDYQLDSSGQGSKFHLVFKSIDSSPT